MARIFISYRRKDSDIWADRLGDALREEFPGRVFMDIREIGPGLPWRTVLDAALNDCTALLVVIGPGWGPATDASGNRRLDNLRDTLRREIAEALRRGVRVFPLLVNGAEMPSPEALPDDLKGLADLQGHDLTVKHWREDVAKLIALLKQVSDLGEEAKPDAEPQALRKEERARNTVDEARRRQAEQDEQKRQAEAETQHAAADKARGDTDEARQRDGEGQARSDAATPDFNAAAESVVGRRRAQSLTPHSRWLWIAALLTGIGLAAGLVVYMQSQRQDAKEAQRLDGEAKRRAVEEAKAADDARRQAAKEEKARVEAQRKVAEKAKQQTGAEAKRKAESAAPKKPPGTVMEPEMVVVPAGRFTMGCCETLHVPVNQLPPHEVVITRPFAVGKYEVTRGEFGQFMDDTKYDIPCWKYAWQQKIPSDHPAVCVSWNDAKAYAKWLADKTGKAYRLLTEAEWEYAARAGTTTKYWWGDEVKEGGQVWANCDGCGSTWDSKSAPVGSFAPNAFGLYDTAGNVNEWVEDCYHDGYTGAPTDGSAWVSGDCRSRVIRGGAWGWDPDHGLSASRHGDASSDSGANLGFRLARTLP